MVGDQLFCPLSLLVTGGKVIKYTADAKSCNKSHLSFKEALLQNEIVLIAVAAQKHLTFEFNPK